MKRSSLIVISIVAVTAVVITIVVLAASGDGGGGISVEQAWARPTASSQKNGAVYFTVTNDGDQADAIVGASVPERIAMSTELHKTMGTAGSATSMDETKMVPVDSIPVKAGSSVTLKPGGYHVMLMDLAQPLTSGEHFRLTVGFAHAHPRTVTVTVEQR